MQMHQCERLHGMNITWKLVECWPKGKSLKEFLGEFWMTNGCMLNSPSIKHYGYIFVNIVNGEEFLCHCTPAQSMICN